MLVKSNNNLSDQAVLCILRLIQDILTMQWCTYIHVDFTQSCCSIL